MASDTALTTVLVSIISSTVVAALITGLLSGRNERRKQLRERRMLLAGDFAGEAMNALALIRHFKPTKRGGHRNEDLHDDPALRQQRADAVRVAIDHLRPLRGRVWVTFPGRSARSDIVANGPSTTADWCEQVIATLRRLEEVSSEFWRGCDADPAARPTLEQTATAEYRAARDLAWAAVDGFAESAARRVER